MTIERTDAEVPILWPPDAKTRHIRKDPDVGKDWRQEKGTTDKMVGWHHWLNGHEFEQAPGVGEGRRSLTWCSPRGHKESDMAEHQNNNKLYLLNANPLTLVLLSTMDTEGDVNEHKNYVARCTCLLKFSFEIIYKVTSILCNTDSYYKSKVLDELGKKKRKLYI